MKTTLTLLCAISGALSLPAFATDGETLFKSKPCAACHSVETKILGPAFKEVAAKYGAQADAPALLIASIQQGSQGKWGPIPMPANAVSDDEARTLAEWILSHQ
jgi:cytochrome c